MSGMRLKEEMNLILGDFEVEDGTRELGLDDVIPEPLSKSMPYTRNSNLWDLLKPTAKPAENPYLSLQEWESMGTGMGMLEVTHGLPMINTIHGKSVPEISVDTMFVSADYPCISLVKQQHSHWHKLHHLPSNVSRLPSLFLNFTMVCWEKINSKSLVE